MGKLFITGDIHGSHDIHKLNAKHFPMGNTLTKEDIVVILGDVGLVWADDAEDKWWINWLNSKPWTTLCVLGNHENYNLIEQLPETTFCGQAVKQVADSVFYGNTGIVYTLCGKNCLFVNGADSHDKEYRKENVSWWSQETITDDEVAIALHSVEINSVDYLFSHTGGSEVCKTLGYAPSPSDYMLDKIINALPKNVEHYCGHYHMDYCINHTTKVLFNDIILLHNTEDDIDDGSCVSIFNGIRVDGSAVIKFKE